MGCSFAPVGSQFGSFQHLDRPHILSASLNVSRRRSAAVKPLNAAEPKRNKSIVPSAATIVAPGNSWSLVMLKNFAFVSFFIFKKFIF